MPPRKSLTPSSGPPPALAAAQVLWRQHRFDEALRKFAEAVRQAPRNITVLIDAGRAFGARGQWDRCDALLGKAQRLGASRANVQFAVGESYRMLGRLVEAEACLRRSCRLAATPQAQIELATICERRHALDEAAELVAAALRAEPNSFAARLLRARIERRRGEADQAESTLREVMADCQSAPHLLAEAFGELASLHDERGLFDAAWEAILECKRIQLQQGDEAWKAAEFVLARCGRMIEALSADRFVRWQSMAEFVTPQRIALLTGFPRSGTTLLERVLDAHPDIVSAEEKEVFSADVFPFLGEGHPPTTPIVEILDEIPPARILAARRMYLEAIGGTLREPIARRLLVDKNPAMNLMIPPFRRLFPELKLIIALRDPRDVVLSCFLRYLPINPVSACFLTVERTAGRFALDLQAWLKMRAMIDGWVEIRYEDTVADLKHEARRALEALGVDWSDAILAYRDGAQQKLVASPTYEAVAKPIFTSSLGRWQNYRRQMEPVLETLAPLVEALGYAN